MLLVSCICLSQLDFENVWFIYLKCLLEQKI
jgi:hypothetical protein